MGDLHPLGFRKYNLLRMFGFRVRLHVWYGEVTAREDRHDHRWSFMSVPLWGRFTDCRWRPAFGDDLTEYVARHPEASKECKLERSRRASLELIARRIRYPLVPYICHRGEIHSYVPRSTPAVSLVFLGRAHSDFSRVWRVDG